MRLRAVPFIACALLLVFCQLICAQLHTDTMGTAGSAIYSDSDNLFTPVNTALDYDATEYCFLQPEDLAYTDFASARAACDPTLASAAFCTSCILGIGTDLLLLLDKAGIYINGEPASAPTNVKNFLTLNELIVNCSYVLGAELVTAGAFTVDTVTLLATCDFSTDYGLDTPLVTVSNTTAKPPMASPRPSTRPSSRPSNSSSNSTRPPASHLPSTQVASPIPKPVRSSAGVLLMTVLSGSSALLVLGMAALTIYFSCLMFHGILAC